MVAANMVHLLMTQKNNYVKPTTSHKELSVFQVNAYSEKSILLTLQRKVLKYQLIQVGVERLCLNYFLQYMTLR